MRLRIYSFKLKMKRNFMKGAENEKDSVNIDLGFGNLLSLLG